MSWEAVAWAFDQSGAATSSQMLVLLALAEQATSRGRNAYPGQDRIAKRTRLSLATVKRAMRELEAAGIIGRGDQSLVTRFPTNRRPVVWDLAMPGSSP